MKTKRITQSNRLGSYLTATLGIGCLAGNSEAAIQIIDISAYDGQNGGVSAGNYSTFYFAGVTRGLEVYNGYYSAWGLDGDQSVWFAVNALANAEIRNFSSGATIDGAATFGNKTEHTAFKQNSV